MKNGSVHQMRHARASKRVEMSLGFAIFGTVLALLCLLCPPAQATGAGPGDLIFVANVEDRWNLWTVDPQSGNTREIIDTRETERYPAVSPGGRNIAYVSDRKEIWILDSLTGKKEKVPLPPGIYAHPAWSPQGNELAFVEYTVLPVDAGEIFTIARKGSDWQIPKKITSFPPMMTFPNYSPDGKMMACTQFHRDRLLGVIEEIGVVDLARQEFTQLTNDKADSFFPVWSPDGTRLAYASNVDGNFNIWVMTYPAGEKQRLTHDKGFDGEPTWSPEGDRIAFVSSRTGNKEIWITGLGQGDERQITHLKKTCSHPFWVK